MKIAIEGMDGVGKTSVALAISEVLGFKYISKPFQFLFETMGFSEKEIKEIEWKLYETEDEALISLFYGMGLMYGTRCIAESNIVFDRHFVSNYYWHGNEETEKLHQEFINLGGLPDLTILLKASTETRIKRMRARDNQDGDLFNPSMYDEGYNKMIDYLQQNNFDFVVVDTENKELNEVIDEVFSIIYSRKVKVANKERTY